MAERVRRGEVDRDGVRREVDAMAVPFCAGSVEAATTASLPASFVGLCSATWGAGPVCSCVSMSVATSSQLWMSIGRAEVLVERL